MKKIFALFLFTVITFTGAASAFAQTNDAGITPNGVLGDVVAVDAKAKQLFVKTDAGSVVVVTLADTTLYKKVAPGETSLAKATDIQLADVVAGDRVLARGKPSDDGKSVAPRMIVVMSKADIAQKHERERAEWKQRGIVGTVTALNPSTKEITIQPLGGRPAAPPAGRSAAGEHTPEARARGRSSQPGAGQPAPPAAPVVVEAGTQEVSSAYAPDSVKFSDAKSSTFEELKVGDQLRALGKRSEDGARFTPEEVVTGAFRTVLGTITAVNPATRELQIKTMPGGQPMTVVVSKDSDVKQVPAEMSQMMGGGGMGWVGRAAPAAAARARSGRSLCDRWRRPGAGGGQASGPGGEAVRGRGMGGGGGRQDARASAAATFEELKPASMIVSARRGADPTRATAIQLVAGIEPCQMMQARAAAAGRPVNLGSFQPRHRSALRAADRRCGGNFCPLGALTYLIGR